MTARLHKSIQGLPVIIDPRRTTAAASAGLYVRAGTRHENPDENGMAHFQEHMAFKGTKRRSALDISRETEARGGIINAYTSHEMTAYHIDGQAQHISHMIDVLCDIIANPTHLENEIETERGAILREIGDSLDKAGDIVWQHAMATSFPDQPLGAPILGPKKNIENLTRDAFRAFLSTHYHRGNIVASVAGNVDPGRVLDEIDAGLAGLPKGAQSAFQKAAYRGGHFHEERSNDEQLHVVLQYESFAKSDKANLAASILAGVLGGGMSSRLFQEIREKRGLVYHVGSGNSAYKDTGLFSIYAATGENDITKLVPVLADEIRKIVHDPITQEEKDLVCEQYRTSFVMNAETTPGRREGNAHSYLSHGRIIQPKETLAKINALTTGDLSDVARRIFSGKPTFVTVGPGRRIESFDKIQNRLEI